MRRFATLAGLLAFVIILDESRDKDNSDPPDGRSGLVVYTDSLSGCQYLKPGLIGGITPRLDAAGNHICNE